jgi:putative transcriptional regulator
MTKAGASILRGLKEASAYMKGKQAGAKTHIVQIPDVKAIRKRLLLSQAEFAKTYRIPLPTLQGWEQGRREPDAPACAYLAAIAKYPKHVKSAVAY